MISYFATIAGLLMAVAPAVSTPLPPQSVPMQASPSPEAKKLFAQGQKAQKENKYNKAAAKFVQACDLGYPASCFRAGQVYVNHLAGNDANVIADDLFERGCSGGDQESCAALAAPSAAVISKNEQQDIDALADKISMASDNTKKLAADARAKRDSGELKAAADLFARACSGLHTPSCAAAGSLYLNELASPENEALARSSYGTGCTFGDLNACRILAPMQYQGKGGKADLEAAAKTYAYLCTFKDADGCERYGALLAEQIREKRSEAFRDATLPIIRASMTKGCQLGNVIACSDAGVYALEGFGGPVNLDDAARYSRLACDGGKGPACNNLGIMVRDGKGVEANATMSKGLFQKGCDLDEAAACNNLGTLLMEQSEQMTKSFREVTQTLATKAFQKACDGADDLGCANLGTQYYLGKGAARDFAKALPPITKACDSKVGRACYTLAVMHRQAQGVPENLSEWRRLSAAACKYGFAQGCANIGIMYLDGSDGMERDRALGLTYLRHSCAGGFDLACRRMTSELESAKGQ
tara:strand:- start:4348 stop:5934 length:1587 start_codon:yes stop_codon:yes gene_type:complete